MERGISAIMNADRPTRQFFNATCKRCIIIIIIEKTRVGKKWKLKKNGEDMFRAVVQLKTVVQQNRIETK